MKKQWVLWLFAGLIISGCSRDEGGSPQQVSFELPVQKSYYFNSDGSAKVAHKIDGSQSSKVSAQNVNSGELGHIIINVSAADMSPIFCSFDVKRKKNSGPCNFDISDLGSVKVGLELTNGTGRLFQVGLAFQDESSDGKISLVYGDSVADLSGSSAAIGISVVESLTGGEGHIRGRYLSGNNIGPTGIMEVKIKPRANRPALTIMKTEMINGWFEAFSMDGVSFEYVVNGELLWGKPMQKNDFQNLSGAGSRHRLVDNDSGYELFGFFGPDGATGGLSAQYPGACAESARFNSCLDLESYSHGPFRTSGSSFSSSGVLSWNFIPGLESFIDGVNIFKVSNDVFDSKVLEIFESDDMVNCGALVNIPGISNLGSKSRDDRSLQLSITSSSGTSVGSGTTFDPTKERLIICPYGKSGSYKSALILPKISGGENQPPYMRLEMSAQYDPSINRYLVKPNECYAVTPRLYLYDEITSMASPWPVPAGSTLTGSLATGSNYVLYSSASCSTASAQIPISFAPGSSTANQFWVKFLSEASDQVFGGINLTGLNQAVEFHANHNRINVTNSAPSSGSGGSVGGGSGITKLAFFGQQVVNEDVCGRVIVKATDSYGNPIPLASGQSIQIDLTSDGSYILLDDSTTCSTAGAIAGVSNIQLSSSMQEYSFRVMSIIPRTVQLKAKITSTSVPGLSLNQEFNWTAHVLSMGSWTRVQANFPRYLNISSSCIPLDPPFSLRDSANNGGTEVDAATNLLWTMYGGSSASNFYSSCGASSGLSTYSMVVGTDPAVYFKHGVGSPGFLKVEVSSSTLPSDVKFANYVTVLDDNTPTKLKPTFNNDPNNNPNVDTLSDVAPSISTCTKIDLNLVDDNGAPKGVTGSGGVATSFEISSTFSAEFYQNNSCTTAISGNVIPATGGQTATIYFKPSMSGTRLFNVKVRPIVSGTPTINSYLEYDYIEDVTISP